MVGELSEVMPPPGNLYQSTTSVASRVIGTAAVLGAAPPNGQTGLADPWMLRSDVADLLNRQKSDGGWAWCSGRCESDPLVTAWTPIALGRAMDTEITVDHSAITGADSYLSGHMNRLTDFDDPADSDGRGDSQRFVVK